MKFKTLMLFFLFTLNVQAIEINCFETDDFDTLCSGVIDQSKVEHINCLDGEPKNETETSLCSNINLGGDGETDDSRPATLNCLDDSLILPEYSFEYQVCSGIPKKESVEKINCSGDLEGSYQINRCKSVDTVKQAWVKKLLWLSNQTQTIVHKPAPDISCLGDKNGDIGDSFEQGWCETQKMKAYVSCEEAAVQGLQSYFNLKFVDVSNLRTFETTKKDSEYEISYVQGPFEVLFTKTVLVSKTATSCFAIEIQ